MSRHTFLTSSSVFGDETETVEIISASDVNKLVDKKNKALMATVDRLENVNRKLQTENRRIKKRCDALSECLSDWSVSRKSFEDALFEITELKKRIDGLKDNCAKIFASVIDELISPKLELFARQIGFAMPLAGKAGEAMDGLGRNAATEKVSSPKTRTLKKKIAIGKSAASGKRNRK